MGEMIEFPAGERPTAGYLATPEGGSGPGVLVLHAWWGLTDVFTGVCDRLAAAGFVALAPDLYDGPTATTVADAERLMEASDGARERAIVEGAIARLRAHPAVQASPIGAVGFSMGAGWAFALSALRPDDIAAVVAFYGIASVEEEGIAGARAAYLGHFGEEDEGDPPAAARELEGQIRGAGRDVTFHIYPGAKHWFFEEDRPDAYDEASARLAWQRTIAFLRGHLGR